MGNGHAPMNVTLISLYSTDNQMMRKFDGSATDRGEVHKINVDRSSNNRTSGVEESIKKWTRIAYLTIEGVKRGGWVDSEWDGTDMWASNDKHCFLLCLNWFCLLAPFPTVG